MKVKKDEMKTVKEISLDIQAILTVIGRRKYFFDAGESIRLNLSGQAVSKLKPFLQLDNDQRLL